MNKELQKIMDVATGIKQADPQTREDFLRGIAQAQTARQKAAEEKENAQSEAMFNKACDDESHARDKEAFFRRLLDKMDSTPRLDEEKYYAAVETVDSVMEKAADAFKRTAKKAIDEIIAARDDYMQTMADADKVLTVLDEAANVLQVKYRYRVTTYTGGGESYTEDPEEWKRHMIRYGNGRGYSLITGNINDPETWDVEAYAALKAAERVTK